MPHTIKQTILTGSLLLALIVASAGIGTQPSDTAVGKKAPVVQLDRVQSAINADELKGKYVRARPVTAIMPGLMSIIRTMPVLWE